MPEKCCLRGRQNQTKQTKRSGQSARNQSTSTKGLCELCLSLAGGLYRQVDGRDGYTQCERHGSNSQRKGREPVRSSIGDNLACVLNHNHTTGNGSTRESQEERGHDAGNTKGATQNPDISVSLNTAMRFEDK